MILFASFSLFFIMFFFKCDNRYFSGISFINPLKTFTLGIMSASNCWVSLSISFSRFSWASLIAYVLLLTYSGYLSLEERVCSMILFCSFLLIEEILVIFPLYGTNYTDFLFPKFSGGTITYDCPNLIPYADACGLGLNEDIAGDETSDAWLLSALDIDDVEEISLSRLSSIIVFLFFNDRLVCNFKNFAFWL